MLVNNAGIEISSLITEVEPDDIRKMLDVNILGTALGLKHGLRAMRPDGAAGKGGSIINISSVAATIAFPAISIYSGTKSAVDRMTRVAAMESGKLGYGVRVNCIYPGLVPTAMGAGLANDMAALGLYPQRRGGGRRRRRADPVGPPRRGRGHGRRRRLPRLRRLPLHQRHRPPGRRRHGHVTDPTRADRRQSMSEKKVVVYGASGYTGRLICEYLREYNVPFVAAGRSQEKLESSLAHNVAGVETADYEIRTVEHDVESLAELFDGASVVCNTVGPFSTLGPVAVEAALKAGVHYTDTTGEQDWLMACDDQWGAEYAEAGLLLAPGIAQMYTTGEIAAQLCLDKPGLDTLDIAVFWGGSPTIASTETILVNAANSAAHFLEQNAYVPFDPGQGLIPLVVPGQHELAQSLPWGGTSHPVWFKRDPRVANCKAQGGVFNAALMNGVPLIVAGAIEATKEMNDDGQGGRAHRDGPPGDGPDAAAREPAGQQVARLGARLRPARPRALRDPRQLQLQADRPDAGVRRLLAAAAAAASRRLRVGLPGVRAPRAARRAALVRPGLRAGAHHPGLSGGTEMRLHDYLDKGASLGADRPCLTTDGTSMSYADVVGLSHEVAAALVGRGLGAGGRVAILSANDPVAFTCVFGISRAGGVWCPINPRNEAAENRELLELFGAEVVLYQSGFAPLVAAIRDELPGVHTWVCLDGPDDGIPDVAGLPRSRAPPREPCPIAPRPPGADELAMLVGTGGTTGRPKGVMLTPTNLETMTALTLMGYPFDGPPVYLALAPLTHAAGVLCFPVLSLGGEVVIMRAPDVGGFLRLVQAAPASRTRSCRRR